MWTKFSKFSILKKLVNFGREGGENPEEVKFGTAIKVCSILSSVCSPISCSELAV